MAATDQDEAAGAALVASMATGGKGAAAPSDPDEAAGMALVKLLGSVKSEPPKSAPAVPSIGNEYGISGDPQQFNSLKGPEIGQPAANVGNAAIQAYKDTPPIFTPQMQAMVDQGGPVGRYITNPLVHALGAIPAGFNALAAAGGQAITEGAQAAGQPALGRDINMLAQVAPVVHFAAGSPMPGVRLPGGPAMADAPRFASERAGEVTPADTVAAPLAQGFRDNPMAPGVANRLAAPPDTIPTMTIRPGEPATQSVGAAASREGSAPGVIDMSPAQVQAYRSTAEGQKLLEPQQPGQADRTAYVPGVSASNAEIEQTVNAARDAKTANIAHPEVSQAAKEQAAANNEKRQQFVESTIKSPVDVMNAKDARAAQAETDLAATWKNKTAADAQPVIDAANEIKASPDGRRPVVRNAIDAVTNELYDADGNLITDPEQLYGVRKHIDDLLSKEAGATDPKSIRAASNLQQLKVALDGAIEPAAPGFQQYLKNFAEASRPIDEMEVLQGHQNKLYDTQGRMQLSRVQGMMRNIVDSRMAPGINPYKSISDETMQRLWALRDDLRRSASAQELARTPGSDTSQTMFDLAKQGLAAGGNLVAHGVAHAIAPIAGPIVLNAVKGGIANRRAATAQRAGVAKGLNNLNPNRLISPQD